MADNETTQSGTLATLPSGVTFGFDDVAGVKIARSKTGFGADGSYTDVSASDPLPVVQTGTPPLPTGAATSAKQDTLIGHLDGVEGLLGTIDADTGNIASATATLAGAVSGAEMQVDVLTVASLPLPTGASTLAEQQTQTTAIGASNETAPATDTASSGLNGRLQRIAQRLTTIIGLLPTSLGAGGGLKVDGSGTALPVSGTVTANAGSGPFPVSDNAGSLTVDAPVGTPVFVRLSDGSTAIATLPVSLASVPSHAVTNAGTFAVQAAQSGTWNITNVSGTVSLPTGAATAAKQPALGTAGAASADVITVQGVASMTALKVDGSAVTQPVSGTVTANLAAGTNAIGKLAANSGVDIGDVDVTSVTPGTGASSLGKAEDAAHTTGDVGVMALAVRNDAGGALAGTTGDYIPLTTDSSGALRVTGGGGGTQYQEDAAHTSGDTGTMALAVRKDSATALAGTDGDYTPLITDANGALHVAISSGTVTASGTISVDTITTSVVPGTSASHLGKAEDAAHTSGDVGVMALAVRKDTAASLAGTDGDYQPPITDSSGRLWVNASGAAVPVTDNSGSLTVDAPVGTPVFVRLSDGASAISALPVTDNSGSLTVDNAGTFAVQAASAGDTAHDSADAGNPVKVGFKAANALPTAVANADRANGISDLWGRQLTSHIDPAMQVTKTVTVTSTQTGSDVWSPTAGKRIAITDLTVSAYGTTAGRVILWFGDNADTTYSEGTDQVLEKLNFAPSATSKPGFKASYSTPVFCTTADRELHLTTDAGISLDITVRGYEW